jgi:hypothetical protein
LRYKQYPVSIIADGSLFFQTSDKYDKDIVPVHKHFYKINEIKIIVSGNTKVWDIGITEKSIYGNEKWIFFVVILFYRLNIRIVRHVKE